MQRLLQGVGLVAALACAGCSVYSAEPISATVVDAVTGMPLESVSVVAAWELRGDMNYARAVGYAKVLEATTDKNGRFNLPSWGPRLTWNGKIRLSAPLFLLFKNGYGYGVYANNGRSDANAPSELRSDWNGKVLPLTPFAGTDQQYKLDLSKLDAIFITNFQQNHRLDDISEFLCAVREQSAALGARGVPDTFPQIEWLQIHKIKC